MYKPKQSSYFMILLILSLLIGNAMPAFAQERVEHPATETAEVILIGDKEFAAALMELGYTEEQSQNVIALHHEIQETYQRGGSEKEMLELARKIEEITGTSTGDFQAKAISKYYHWVWLFQLLHKGAAAKYDVKFGPYLSVFTYFDTNWNIQTHWKGGFCTKLSGSCTVTHTSSTQGFYIGHGASGNAVSNHSWWPL